MTDPSFHALVQIMVAHIEAGKFTPTEMREAALLAHIIYQENHVGLKTLPFEISEWLSGNKPERSKDDNR
jgi:hypothetical protein